MAIEDNSQREIRFATAALILGVFLSGAALGAGLCYLFLPMHQRPPMPPWAGRGFSDMHLTADQEQKTQEVMERHRPALDSIVKEGYPKVRAEVDKMDAEIRAILTEEQQKKFDEMKERRGAHGMGFLPNGRPGMGFPPGRGPPPEFMAPPASFPSDQSP